MKLKKIILYALVGLLALQFTFIGLAKTALPFFGFDMFVNNMAALNYNRGWTFAVGLVDLLGGLGLLVPRLRGYAALGLIFLLHGAIGSHFTHNDPPANIVGGAAMSIVLLVLVLMLDKPFAITDKRNQLVISQ